MISLVQFGDAFINPEEVAAVTHSDYNGRTRIDLRSGAHVDVDQATHHVARKLVNAGPGLIRDGESHEH